MLPGFFLYFLVIIALAGCSTEGAIRQEDQKLDLKVSQSLLEKFDCDQKILLSGDPYRVARMTGFYCVTGKSGNFRVFKVFNSPSAAKSAAADFASLQTGGRKLVEGDNWFLLGLKADIAIFETVKFQPSSNALGFYRSYSESQDLCMIQLTSLLESSIRKQESLAAYRNAVENQFPGALEQIDGLDQVVTTELERRFTEDSAFVIDQKLGEASISYRRFCLQAHLR